MEREPVRRIPPPPDVATQQEEIVREEERVRPPKVAGARPSRLEWVVSDLDMKVAPHMEVFMPGLWKRMHDDDTFKMFFHEGPEMSFVQFGAALTNPLERLQIVVGHDADGTAKEHAGLLILNHILVTEKVKRAVGNFLFFREYWNRHDTDDLARAVLNHWFGVLDFDVISGITPRQNRAAIQFIKRAGFQIVGDVPMFTTYDGEPSASAVSYMTRKMWQERYQPQQPSQPRSSESEEGK